MRVVDVDGYDHPARGYFIAYELGRKVFFLRREEHLFGDRSLSCVI